MSIPALAIGGLLGAAEGNRQNILKEDPNDPGGKFLNYYIKDRLPTILGGVGGALVGNKMWGKPGVGGLVGAGLGHVLSTPEAQEARKDQSGFWPELGLSEGLGATIPGLKW